MLKQLTAVGLDAKHLPECRKLPEVAEGLHPRTRLAVSWHCHLLHSSLCNRSFANCCLLAAACFQLYSKKERARRGFARRATKWASETLKELQGLKTRALKAALEARGFCTEGSIDRPALLELLDSVPEPPRADSAAEPPTGEPATAWAQRVQELRTLRARDLRRELAALGLRTDGCTDKESLLELLDTQGIEKLKTSMEDITSIPLEMLATPDQFGVSMEGKHINLNLLLGGLPYRFVLDTGASNTMIMESMAGALQSRDLGVNVWATGAMGSRDQHSMRVVSVDQAQLGDMDCGPVQMVITPQALPVPPGTAGILGLDIILKFDWDINIASGSARAAPASEAQSSRFDLAGMHEIPMSRYRTTGPEVVTVTLWARHNTKQTWQKCLGVLYLGAVQSLCNTSAAQALGLGPAELHDTGSVVAGVGGAPVRLRESQLVVALEGTSGSHLQQAVTVFVGDLPFFAQLGLDSCGPVVLLGMDVLARSRTVLLASRNLICLPL
eukprot:TRINITY_DN76602_c0_g1_i1.p1 TRINITY_DN76602_c0_g1~~TRINITY_DN76602_c0_g1_i1.p1  ORF type:complete len:500 (-),score=69.57 TRINITY_DN76602_c0_g1_i1:22-1521(-)